MHPFVVGTAGHIDHGKTSLVFRLTGTDTDRLPEEKARGISIELGFAFAELRPGALLSFVDVPGHERFVKNMLAGATGMDSVLLVVAADEGLMPQTREHFDIVRLLGIASIFGVITKIDLVDQEMLELARLELEDYLSTALGRTPPVFEVSSKTGAGCDALLAALIEELKTKKPRLVHAAARLSIDRKFILQGHGSVVTGTQASGLFRVGDAVEIWPQGLASRIRGLQIHSREVEQSEPGQRVAMKLHGVALEELERGNVICHPGTFEPAWILNVQIELLEKSPIPLKRRTRVRLHLGAAEVLARVEPLEEEILTPGKTGFLQLRLDSPVVAAPGQKLILRRYSPAVTIAGGIILEIPAPKSTSGDPVTCAILKRLLQAQPEDVAWALASRSSWGDVSEQKLRQEFLRRGLEPSHIEHLKELVRLDAGVWMLKTQFQILFKDLLQATEQHHKNFPLEPGIRPEHLRQGALERLPAHLYQAMLQTLLKSGHLVAIQDRFKLPSFTPLLDEASQDKLAVLVQKLDDSGPWEEAVFLDELRKISRQPAAMFQYLLNQEGILRMGGFVQSHRALARLLELIRASLASSEGLSVAQLREKTGWSRKFCIPFLELTDSLYLTRRRGDVRVIGTALSSFLEKYSRIKE